MKSSDLSDSVIYTLIIYISYLFLYLMDYRFNTCIDIHALLFVK